MSKTHCRFCKKTFEGLYLHCPECNRNLMPVEYQSAREIIKQFGKPNPGETDAK